MYIICYNDGIIQDIHDNFITILECDNNIIMQPISNIILYTTEQLYKKNLYPTVEQSTQNKAQNIQLIMRIFSNKYIKVDTRITYYKNIYCITILKVEPIDSNIIYTSQLTLSDLSDLSDLSSINNMITISLNIKDYVELMNKNIINFIDTYTIFYNQIIELIKSKYYNFIYIHNTMNNNIILFANINSNYNTIAATLVHNFILDLHKITNIFDANVSCDTIYYSMIDKLQFFSMYKNHTELYKSQYYCYNIDYYNKLIEEKTVSEDIV